MGWLTGQHREFTTRTNYRFGVPGLSTISLHGEPESNAIPFHIGAEDIFVHQ